MGNCFSSQKQDLDKDKAEHVEEILAINAPPQQTPPGNYPKFFVSIVVHWMNIVNDFLRQKKTKSIKPNKKLNFFFNHRKIFDSIGAYTHTIYIALHEF